MRKLILVILVVLTSGAVFSQSPARVYLIRKSQSSGIFESYKVFMDGTLMCRLNNFRYSVHEVEPGVHLFSVQNSGEKSKKKAESKAISINIESGHTYYVSFQSARSGMFEFYPLEITENSAKVVMTSLKEDIDCFIPKTMQAKKN
jgi:hypothetical protein